MDEEEYVNKGDIEYFHIFSAIFLIILFIFFRFLK